MPGSTYHALNTAREEDNKPSQLERFRSAAKEGPVREELVSIVGIDTGLRADAIGHMTKDWLNSSGNQFRIEVPPWQKCTLGIGPNGSGGDTTNGNAPCAICRNRNTDRDWLPKEESLPDEGDCWVPKSESGVRSIPVKEDHAQKILLAYFNVHNVVMTKQNIAERVKSTAERAGVLEENGPGQKSWPTTHDLRDTYGHRLARKGFDRFEIKSAMGHASVEQAQDYIDLSSRETDAAFEEKW